MRSSQSPKVQTSGVRASMERITIESLLNPTGIESLHINEFTSLQKQATAGTSPLLQSFQKSKTTVQLEVIHVTSPKVVSLFSFK
jgi:hypothetical protein